MHAVLNPANIVDWLGDWGYLGIFVCVFVGNLGIPVPEETVMLVAGFLAGRAILDLKYVYLICVLSAVSGDCCGFFIGRLGGQRIIARLAGRFTNLQHRYQRLQLFFHTHGSKAVFMARFIAGVRFMAGPMAGAAGMPFFRFLGWNLLGAIVWCTLVVTIGYLVGDELYRVAEMAHHAQRWFAMVVVLLCIALWFFWLRDRNEGPAAPRSEPEA
ncbi:MAG TPA: DedA family protein [Candidatus Binataceae bacterium]|nr:DedA family protein [Candidatus Binataceae bacterium]